LLIEKRQLVLAAFFIISYLCHKINLMGRILAIDYGRKRAGVAVTDPLKIIANGLDTVPSHTLIEFLRKYFSEEDVEQVIIGYPMQMNNTPSESVLFVNEFIKRFKKVFPDRNIAQVDERFTSKIASRVMIESGIKKQQRKNKALVDKISATLILQSYLETKNIKL